MGWITKAIVAIIAVYLVIGVYIYLTSGSNDPATIITGPLGLLGMGF